MTQLSRTPSRVPLILTLVLVGLNLRPSMAAIGPLLTPIRHSIPLSYTVVSLLTMLPVLAMGIAMFRGARLAARWGEHRVISIALLVIGLASLARLHASTALDLILTAVVAGMGIAVIQSVMPGIIKSRFPNAVALLMGVYVTAIMGGAALAASTSPFIGVWLGGWQRALAAWAALAAVALAAWYAIRGDIVAFAAAETGTAGAAVQDEPLVARPRAWLLGIFFGLGTASYTCVLAWLPPFYVEQGWPDTHAGLLLAYLTGMEVVSGLVMPALASRHTDRRPVLLLVLASVIAGFVGLILAPVAYPVVWAGLLGIGIGGLFPLSLIVAMDHMDAPRRAGQLAAFVQGVGYLIAAMSPLIAGFIKDVSSSFTEAWLLLAVVTVAMMLMVQRFRPADYPRHFAVRPAAAER
ncbi:cyanate transporter [Burkholderia glumae]|uniref:Cyanate transporter n=1 Tax=Burkholderia glumae TaxID=337 RepID=A0AAP9XYJ3_BURGL|nr:cyanate transporter [Burkholderia glumae]ACR31694.1 Cyanate transporter [Burkholderia glumae BGR1]KHJ62190.1 MFS transporter [Burkholderia glumae]MCM2485135.1 cyanate transporter [Burkholderia glumae]MCM2510828.1 cyanate transporter [Burkholderia glumae]MCM2540664.1 cyanate transporter [Burkholderia glumae]